MVLVVFLKTGRARSAIQAAKPELQTQVRSELERERRALPLLLTALVPLLTGTVVSLPLSIAATGGILGAHERALSKKHHLEEKKKFEKMTKDIAELSKELAILESVQANNVTTF